MAEVPPWLEGLNEAQRAAVDHDGGPLMILAGAGTGKTRTLVARLARLIAGGTPPERILLVTFSRRAADQMTRRASALIDHAGGAGSAGPVAGAIDAGTFHAVAQPWVWRRGSACSTPATRRI
jgi:DNA helicase II / ATP-dependent DNA helicase PcrA